MKTILLYGYEKTKSKNVLRVIVANKPQVVVDVRQYPYSNKRIEVCKDTLMRVLATHGISYFSFPALGISKNMLWGLIKTNSYNPHILEKYKKYIAEQIEKKNGLVYMQFRALLKVIEKNNRIMLFGYYANPDVCHRIKLVELIQEQGFDVEVIKI